MKHFACLLALSLLLGSFAAVAQGVGVGTTTPAASAVLDVTSTTKGVLLPRMTAAQRDAIASPAQNLLVFQTDGTPGLYYYSNTAWVNLGTGFTPDASGSTARVRVGTLAGNGSTAFVSVDGTGTAAQIYSPTGMALDGSGNYLYVTDKDLHCIRQIAVATGVVTTLAGTSGSSGNINGTGTAARFFVPTGVTADGSGNVYVADAGNNSIRKIVTATGVVSTFVSGLTNPRDLAIDGSGNMYVAETSSNRIRKIVMATAAVSILAGTGTAGYADGAGTAALFNNPTSVTVDYSGNVYVSDQNNNRIRKIVAATGVVSTLAGSGTPGYANGAGTAAQFNSPYGVSSDGFGTVYVSDTGNNRIRMIVVTTGAVSTLAGNGTSGYADGAGTAAQFNGMMGMVVGSNGAVYTTDYNYGRVRVTK